MEDSSCPTENRCHKSSSREFRRISSFHSYSLHRKRWRSNIGRTARVRWKMTFEERDTPNQAVVRIVNGTDGAWSIQYEIREIISPASTKQAMEMQAEAERRKREEILQSEGDQKSEISLAGRKPQDCDSVEQQSLAQDPRAHSQPKLEDVTSKESSDKAKIRLSEINKHVSDGIHKESENQNGRRSSLSPKLSWWMSWTHFSTRFRSLRRGQPRTLHFSQKEIDTRNPNIIRTALIKTSRFKSPSANSVDDNEAYHRTDHRRHTRKHSRLR